MNAFKNKKGAISVAAVALLLAVCLSPMLVDESDAASKGDGTVYLRPGDTYTWTTTFNIDKTRVSVQVNTSTTSTVGSYSSTSTAGGVTATVTSDKNVTLAVASGTSPSTVYVSVKAVTTSGVTQTAVATITVKVINPTISYSTVNTYQGGTVSVTPTTNNTSIDSKTVTYTATGLPSGLSCDAATGKITGTVSSSAEAKTYTVKVIGTVSTVPSQTFSTSFDIMVAKSMTLTAPGDQYTAKGTPKDITLNGTNTTTGTTWKITSGSVSGITMSTATGTAGKITVANSVAAGTYTVGYSATNPTSGQVVTGSVKITVGSVSIDSISTSGGKVESKTGIYTVAGTAATFTVSATSNPSASNLGLTLSVSGTDADKITLSGQTISVSKDLAAGTYTFTLTETQASTGAVASVNVTLTVDPVFDFKDSVTSGSLTTKGAGN